MRGGFLVLLQLCAASVSTSPYSHFSTEDEEFHSLLSRGKRQETAEICDFGSDTDLVTCDWSNRNGTHMRWDAGAGSLSNWLGGPPKDASPNDDSQRGGYVYYETSFLPTPHTTKKGQHAYIESSTMGTTGPEGKCVGFSFSMSGLSATGLRVILKPRNSNADEDDDMERVLWSNKDPTGGQWRQADVLYTYNKEHQVVFEGIAKSTSDPLRRYRGHVAVDNVALKPGTDCRGHCTFEGGFCAWTNDEDDDFDWSLGRGSTNPSTGPAMDCTSYFHGGMEGGYGYIDSSYPRRPGDVARLSSPEMDATGVDTPLCLSFWTHMYGNGIGTLTILLMDVREGNERDIWTLSGEQGNAWYQAEVPVSSPNPFKIVIVGKVGKNIMGDIAVDDLAFRVGSCPTAPQIAAPMPGDCTFEVDECGWANVPSRERMDDIDWERVSGVTGAEGRPQLQTFDHTLSTDKGFYMTLARSSNVQRPASRAWFTSREFPGSANPHCVSFWFVLNEPFIGNSGPSLGALSVYTKVIEPDGNVIRKPVWKLYNHQGPEWHYAQALIQEEKVFTIFFEGIWGSSLANGLIGFDDITLFDGSCSTVPASATVHAGDCRFERDICSWINSTASNTFWKLATVASRPANLPDKTYNAPEGYIYFDLFNSGSSVVRLTSPHMAATEDRQLCFAFWFTAFGSGESAELHVVRVDNTTDDENRKLWSLEARNMDTSNPTWQPAQVAIDAGTDFRIVLEGRATNGGFAIDDISFTTGACSTRPDKATPKEAEEEDG
ncbi:MAM and LDL-receptor class A domain-containing protein 1-like [Cloeon dipterum]|uniref:MAM and LDL-receptor class A domain-containing protein 1-like n=1 Tax=Cloeon dipterum TaxID=197152 RepID=UPI00322024B0